MKEKEVWKDIPEYEGLYQVSNLGRVRSVDRIIVKKNKATMLYKGKILKYYEDTKGRLSVSLSKNDKKKNIRVHIIVAETFISKRPDKKVICHINGNNQDNRLVNLRYDTQSENIIDIYRQGKKHGKLSTDEVIEIRRLYSNGEYTQTELAEKFNVSLGTIECVINRRTYYWLNDDGTIEESKTAVSQWRREDNGIKQRR